MNLKIYFGVAALALVGCAVSGPSKSTTAGTANMSNNMQSSAKKPVKEWIEYAQKMNSSGLQERCTAGSQPLIIAHRGASGYRPEHTLEAYTQALDMGADFIEPDLVMTKDRVLIVRHENEISQTTDVATKYPKRQATKVIDGQSITGWFTEDFTLAEIKNLRAKERLDGRPHIYDGKFEIATFEDVLVFARLQEKKRRRPVGIVPELKHSTYFRSIHKPLEDSFVYLMKKYKYDSADSLSKAMVQSFEVENLKKLRPLLKNIAFVQLLDEPQMKPQDGVTTQTYAQMATPQGLKAIREYADWVSPWKNYIVNIGENGMITEVSNFVGQAHAAGLKVVPYTFRSDTSILPRQYESKPELEYQLFFNLGVDAVFSDFSDHAVKARQNFLSACSRAAAL